MCGIFGIKSLRSINKNVDIVKTACNLLKHRGPDNLGIWHSESQNIAMGHTRLSIIDLQKTGDQPMISNSSRYVLVYNGEIYNYQEIKKNLDLKFPTIIWKGTSDTEVLLASIDSVGIEKTLQNIDGMFAFALWDNSNNELTLARDRIGEKPLYYGWSKGKFIFGSELKAIKSLKGFNNAIDRDSLGLYLRHCYIPSPRTIYKDIYKLSPGCILEVQLGNTFSKPSKTITLPFSEGSFHVNQYWSYKNVVQKGRANLIEDEKVALSYLEESLRESIRLQSIADVPLGAFLSGGIDSSLIVSLMQSESISPVHTYTIGFEDAGFNEAVHAKKVAEHLNTNHTDQRVRKLMRQAFEVCT